MLSQLAKQGRPLHPTTTSSLLLPVGPGTYTKG